MATKTAVKITPLGDRMVLKTVAREEKTVSGIILPDSAQEKPMKAEVIAVGPGRVLDNGTVQKMEVKVGDHILYGKYSGTEIKIDGEDFLILKETEVLGIFSH